MPYLTVKLIQDLNEKAGARSSARSAKPTYCFTRAETERSYRAINAFGKEVFRVTGSLPFCIDSLRMRIDSHGTYIGKVTVRPWAEGLLLQKKRTKFVKARLVSRKGDSRGSVAGRSEHQVVFMTPGISMISLNCPRIKIRAFGDLSIKSPGRASGGC